MTNERMGEEEKPAFSLGTIVSHPHLGQGKILGYEGNSYRIVFKGGDARLVQFSFQGMEAESMIGNPEIDLLKIAVKEVFQDYGWLESEFEMSNRWQGGTLVLEPGNTDTQAKEIPLEVFFKKLIGVREKLRVLEQKINNHPSLSNEEKLDLEGYITRCYGSLTTFNVLFASKECSFSGQGKKQES